MLNVIKKIQNLSTRAKDQQDPINRLNEAFQKLNHEDLDLEQIEQMKIPDVEKAFKICQDIETKNNEIKRNFYEIKKGTKKILIRSKKMEKLISVSSLRIP